MQEETTEETLEKLRLEREVSKRSLLNHGMTFDVPKLSLLKYLPWGRKNEQGNPVRRFKIHKFYLYTMDRMAIEKLELKINLEELRGSENPIRHKNQLVNRSNWPMCKILAYAVLNRRWKIKLFGNWLAGYLQARILPENLLPICRIIEDMEDAGNFINSTVLMAGSDRTSQPKTGEIEIKPPKAEVKQ